MIKKTVEKKTYYNQAYCDDCKKELGETKPHSGYAFNNYKCFRLPIKGEYYICGKCHKLLCPECTYIYHQKHWEFFGGEGNEGGGSGFVTTKVSFCKKHSLKEFDDAANEFDWEHFRDRPQDL